MTLFEFQSGYLVLINCSSCKCLAIAKLENELGKQDLTESEKTMSHNNPPTATKKFELIHPLNESDPMRCKKCLAQLNVVEIISYGQKTIIFGHPI